MQIFLTRLRFAFHADLCNLHMVNFSLLGPKAFSSPSTPTEEMAFDERLLPDCVRTSAADEAR